MRVALPLSPSPSQILFSQIYLSILSSEKVLHGSPELSSWLWVWLVGHKVSCPHAHAPHHRHLGHLSLDNQRVAVIKPHLVHLLCCSICLQKKKISYLCKWKGEVEGRRTKKRGVYLDSWTMGCRGSRPIGTRWLSCTSTTPRARCMPSLSLLHHCNSLLHPSSIKDQ